MLYLTKCNIHFVLVVALLQIKLFRKKDALRNKAILRLEEPFLPKLKIQGINEQTPHSQTDPSHQNYHDNDVVVIGEGDHDGPIVHIRNTETSANDYNTVQVLVECENINHVTTAQPSKSLKPSVLDTYECITIYEAFIGAAVAAQSNSSSTSSSEVISNNNLVTSSSSIEEVTKKKNSYLVPQARPKNDETRIETVTESKPPNDSARYATKNATKIAGIGSNNVSVLNESMQADSNDQSRVQIELQHLTKIRDSQVLVTNGGDHDDARRSLSVIVKGTSKSYAKNSPSQLVNKNSSTKSLSTASTVFTAKTCSNSSSTANSAVKLNKKSCNNKISKSTTDVSEQN